MLTIRAMSDGQGYAAKHLQNNDYYAEGEKVIGVWRGYGAQMLCLSGEVKHEQFEAVRQGLNPTAGEFLRQRHSADRIASDGSIQGRARTLYDFTFSAPKSVSVAAQLAGDDRLVEAHRTAVDEALTELEKHGAARVRLRGANEDRTTGNMVLAVYHHDTSRELDPQIHTHAVAANLTFDGTEGRWKALQASEFFVRHAYLTEVYRNALAREVTGLGYKIENQITDKSKDAGFEIQGVSRELIERFSKRSRQRDDAIEEFRREHGRLPSNNEIAVLVRETRAQKLTEISTPEVRMRQQEQLSAHETQHLLGVKSGAQRRAAHCETSQEAQFRRQAAQSLEHAEQHIFERLSVAHDHQLFAEALRHGRGRIQLPELHGSLRLQERSGQALRYRSEIATRESLERERQMVAAINDGIGRFDRLGGPLPYAPSEVMQGDNRTQQRHAVEFVLNSRDFAVNLRGAAGTGKTDTLQEIHRGLRQAGGQVLAVAPTATATEELNRVGFTNAVTIDRLLQDQELQIESHGHTLIVDEAGMISGRQMHDLLQLARRTSRRVVFSGDTRQIQSVEAGDALRILERESQLKSTSLTQVHRQSAKQYREAVEELRRNPQRGLDRLEQMNAVQQVHIDERAAAVEKAYWHEHQQLNSKGQKRTVLVVAATHEEIDTITAAIRNRRMHAGELRGSVTTERFVPLQFTTAQKSDPRNFTSGQVLIFHRKTRDARKNEVFEIVRTEDEKIVARNERGREIRLSAKQAKSFDVFERRPITVAPDDRLLLMANRRDKNFRAANGELATVAGFDEHGRILLQDGRALPSDYRQFTHGYAITAHRSQGKTVDAVIISADAMLREPFYVAASRARESIAVITSDKEGLRNSISQSGQRQSATELKRKSDDIAGASHRTAVRHENGRHAGYNHHLDHDSAAFHHHVEHRKTLQRRTYVESRSTVSAVYGEAHAEKGQHYGI